MSTVFNPTTRLILLDATIHGPSGVTVIQFVLDTGSNRTVVRAQVLIALGYDPAGSQHLVQLTSATGVTNVPVVTVSRVEALGQDRQLLPVLAHNLPANTGYDGLVGLDFLRGRELRIDFRKGLIDLT